MKKVFHVIAFQVFVITLMGQQPKLILPIGHGADYIPMFSPDGKKILTLSLFEPSKIWDGATGKLLVDSLGHLNRIYFAVFSPDGKKIVTCNPGDPARIWDLSTGKLLVDSIENISGSELIQFSSDGDFLLDNYMVELTSERESDDTLARIWDAGSGKLLVELNWKYNKASYTRFRPDGKPIPRSDELSVYFTNHRDDMQRSSLSPDGKKILTISSKGELNIWNSFSGKLLHSFTEKFRMDGSEIFSPDGKRLITFNNLNKAKIWDATTGRLLVEWNEEPLDSSIVLFNSDGKNIMILSTGGMVRIRDAANGQLIAGPLKFPCDYFFSQFISGGNKFNTPIPGLDSFHKISDILSDMDIFPGPGKPQLLGFLFQTQISPDGKKMTSFDKTDHLGGIGTTKIRDAHTGNILFELKGHNLLISDCIFSSDGTKMIALSWDSTYHVRDVETGRFLVDLSPYSFWRNPFSDDGKQLLLIDKENSVVLLDASNGKILNRVKKEDKLFKDALLSTDGKKIMSFVDKSNVMIWDAMNGKLLSELKGKDRFSYSRTYLSPDGEKVATVSTDTVTVVDANSGNILMQCTGQHPQPLTFSPDGKKILTGSKKDEIRLWDILSGNVLATIPAQGSIIKTARFNLVGDKILTVTNNDKVRLWNVLDGYLIADLSDSLGWEVNAQFTKDGNKIKIAPRGGKVKIWDAVSGKLISELKKESSPIYDARASLSPDGKIITTYWGDNVFRKWDARTGELLYKFWSIDSTDYLVVDPSNRFDGTEAARKLLYFVCGDEVVELDQLKDQLWVPNLAERINNGETINAKTLDELNICGLTPEVEDASSKTDEYYFKITPRRGGLGEIILSVNGNPTKTYKPEQLKKNGGIYELIIKKAELNSYFITGEENQVTVKAYTSGNAISSRGLKINEVKTNQVATPPNLYAVMVGVSDYKGDELDLKYAAKDATDISATVANVAKKLLDTLDGKEHVFMYNLTTAKEHYLLPEKNSIKKTLEEIGKKATANDILLIFFAGHGVMKDLPAGEAEGKKQFYFLTADASKTSALDAVADVGISTAELTEWMKPQHIKAQKRILIFDACNSGQAIKDFVKMGKEDQGYLAARNDDKAQQIKAIDKLNEQSGLFILSASATNQSAYEMGRYSQGLLTYSLLKAIKQQPDILNQGKYLDVSRWFNAAKESVADLAKESGARQEPQIVSNTNFNIGVVDADVMAKIVLPQEKPLFASSNFQNSDESADGDNLELSKLINLQLNEIAARGMDSKIIYVTATNSPDAFTLSGRYDVKVNEITIRVSIKKNNETKYRFEEKGTKEKLQDLATTLVTKAAEWAAAGN